ncbi:MAG: hypothetical protein ACXWP1_08155, partial [Bdellovibrionota bacterium]
MFVASSCLVPSVDSPKESVAPAIPLHALPEDGLLPEGSLIEISGPDARLQAARILAENRQLPAAWI